MSSYDKVSNASKRIREALNIREMKAVELAEKSGINKASISCYMSGKYEPKQEALYKMGKALDVAEMWLAGYDIPMERPLEQKENDQFVDLIERLRTDKGFRNLVLKLSNMDPSKIESIMNLLDVNEDY